MPERKNYMSFFHNRDDGKNAVNGKKTKPGRKHRENYTLREPVAGEVNKIAFFGCPAKLPGY